MKKRVGKKKKSALPARTTVNGRILLLGLGMFTCFSGLLGRVAYIKSVHGKTYEKAIANRMTNGEQDIIPQRGAIVDRNNKTLATSVLTYNVIISPKDILTLTGEKQQEVYAKLAEKVDKTAEEIKQLVEVNPTSMDKTIAKNMPVEEAEELQSLKGKGVFLRKSYTRKYPKGTLAAQLIGFYNKNGEGQYGIEQQYETYLVGKTGRSFAQYQDSQIVTQVVQSPEAGTTIKLTLDEVIQQYVASTMEKYIKEHNPINASAIIMNPNTGEVYSMYSYPEFDPNTYNDLSAQLGASVWNSLSDEKQYLKMNEAWINRAVQYTYEPGSTFKPIFVAAALDEGIIDGTEHYNCLGSKVVAGQRIGCWKKSGHGEQTLEEALANSCNVAMMDISSKIDSATFLDYMARYGFGKSTGVGLPGDNPGLLHSKLGPVEAATYSIGQTMTVTPLQLITAFSAVINGGYLVEPYVVSEIIAENKEVIETHENRILRQVISTDTSKLVTNYLKKVVDDGTGAYAAINGYDIGGKTGTAEKQPRSEGKYVLSFMGYAPINNPQVIGLIIFDEIPEGTGAPAKAFKEIMENILPYLEIELSKDVQSNTEQTSATPHVVGRDIYTAIATLSQKGLDYELIGVGTQIKEQYPKEGVTLSKGSKVKIYVETEKADQIIEVPDVMGKTLAEAEAILKGNFTVKKNGEGTVSEQIPKAGSKIEKNSQVILKTTE